MLKELPLDIQRYLSKLLVVRDCLSLELCIRDKINRKTHYEDRLYKEEYKHNYKFHDKIIYIETCRVKSVLFSLVKPMKDFDSHFIIRHTEEISTRGANRKAFKVITDKQKKILARRLEMLNFYE